MLWWFVVSVLDNADVRLDKKENVVVGSPSAIIMYVTEMMCVCVRECACACVCMCVRAGVCVTAICPLVCEDIRAHR